jgi:hypothetical protein
MQGEGMSYFLADSFYNQTDYIVIFVITTYCALVLLPLFMVSRLFYINRLFYEGLPFPITSMIFGVPFAKFLTLNYGGDSSLLVPFIDLKFLQFFVPAILIVHPAMQFANWLMPEIDDLYRNPAYFWRRLNIEREIQKSKQRH